MDYPFLFYREVDDFVPLCLLCICVCCLQNVSCLQRRYKREKDFPSRMEEMELPGQMNEEQLSSWPWIISVLTLAKGTVVSQCLLFEYGR